MLIQPGALQPVPDHAVVPQDIVVSVLRKLSAGDALQPRLDALFRQLEREQPALAEFVAAELAELEQPSIQARGYFLFLAVFFAFRDSCGSRLCPVALTDLELVLDRLIADGEVRSRTCRAESYSEDRIAVGQPALMRLVRSEVEQEAENDEAGAMLQALLVEIVALTSAVAPLG